MKMSLLVVGIVCSRLLTSDESNEGLTPTRLSMIYAAANWVAATTGPALGHLLDRSGSRWCLFGAMLGLDDECLESFCKAEGRANELRLDRCSAALCTCRVARRLLQTSRQSPRCRLVAGPSKGHHHQQQHYSTQAKTALPALASTSFLPLLLRCAPAPAFYSLC